ncbi:MAG: flagellar biosynthetic protein FliO [Mariprofundaceae bacterium]|nr:flagellar biosynthetic protein FliO [Mariprofundaceae bacterium]
MQDSLLTLVLQSVAGLAVVLALFGLVVWILKRFQEQRYASGHNTGMHIVQRCGIDPKHSIVELAYGERRYLIGLSPDGMERIDCLSTGEIQPRINTAPSDGKET